MSDCVSGRGSPGSFVALVPRGEEKKKGGGGEGISGPSVGAELRCGDRHHGTGGVR